MHFQIKAEWFGGFPFTVAGAYLLLNIGYVWGSVRGDEESVLIHNEHTFQKETGNRQGND